MKILSVDITEKEKSILLEDFKNIESGYICVTSVHGLIEAYEDEAINLAFKNSYANVPDGMPIVYFARWFKKISMERITGPDFIYDVLRVLEDNKSSLCTIGSNKGTIQKFTKFINKNYPDISVIGSDTSIVDLNSEDSLEKILQFCKKNPSDYFFIFLSTPKQDLLMHHISRELKVKLIGFGAAVDYVVGNTKYAPNIIKKLSLEWLYRLLQEPRRLFKRYFNIIPKFFVYLVHAYFQKAKKS